MKGFNIKRVAFGHWQVEYLTVTDRMRTAVFAAWEDTAACKFFERKLKDYTSVTRREM